MFFKFSFMFPNNCVADKISSLNFPLIDNNFMMFSKLYFIIFNRLI